MTQMALSIASLIGFAILRRDGRGISIQTEPADNLDRPRFGTFHPRRTDVWKIQSRRMENNSKSDRSMIMEKLMNLRPAFRWIVLLLLIISAQPILADGSSECRCRTFRS